MKNTGMGLKAAVLASMMALAFVLPGHAGDDTYKISKDRSIPGKFGKESCDPFARELYSRLTRAGGEAHYIVYQWQNPNGGSGCHAFVVYRDSKGRYFGMDQKRSQPVWLAGSNPQMWASWFNGPGYTRVVRTVTEDSLAGQYADLSRPAKMNIGSVRMLAMK